MSSVYILYREIHCYKTRVAEDQLSFSIQDQIRMDKNNLLCTEPLQPLIKFNPVFLFWKSQPSHGSERRQKVHLP